MRCAYPVSAGPGTLRDMPGQTQRWTDRNSAADFDGRYTGDSLEFWVPKLIDLGSIASGEVVLDLGCGTGGFAAAIAERARTRVVGCDLAERFVGYAHARRTGSWIVGDAARIPLRGGSVDCVLMSLLLHRVPDAAAVVADAARILCVSGRVVIKTVSPDVAADSAQYRFFPSMVAAQRMRLPSTERLRECLRHAGLADISVAEVARDIEVRADRIERDITRQAPVRYPEMSAGELAAGLQRLRSEARSHNGSWMETRTSTILVGRR